MEVGDLHCQSAEALELVAQTQVADVPPLEVCKVRVDGALSSLS